MTPKNKTNSEAKPELKHVAVVVQVTHGRFFRKHHHYMVTVVEVTTALSDHDVKGAMQESIEFAKKIGIDRGAKLKVLTAQKVDVVPNSEIKGRSSRSISSMLETLLKN